MKITLEEKREEQVPAGPRLEDVSEKEKWSKMDSGQRRRYIWDYYKVPILVVIGVIAAILYTVHEVTAPKSILTVTIVNFNATEEFTAAAKETFPTRLGMNPKKEPVVVASGYFITGDETRENHAYTAGSEVALAAQAAAGDIDLFVMDRFGFESLALKDYLGDMSAFLTENGLDLQSYVVDGEVGLPVDGAIPTDESDIPTETRPVGLLLTDNEILKLLNAEEPVYIGVAVESSGREMAAEFLRFISGSDGKEQVEE